MVKRRAFGMEPASGVALDEHHIQRRDDSCSSDYRAEYVPCRAIVDAAGFGSTKEIHSVQLTPLAILLKVFFEEQVMVGMERTAAG